MTSNAVSQAESDPKPLGESFEIRLKMISDWHIGSGGGRPGSVDSLVRRDSENLPYLPAKTLTGIWRDACERVALGLDDGNKAGGWNQWVKCLFGDQPAIADAERKADKTEPGTDKVWSRPQRAALSVRSAYLPSDLRQALRSRPVAREAVTFVKPGISIHPRTGSARNDFLRFEEMVRGGISLIAKAELCGIPDEDRKICSALLIAGARLVERLGGKRRRGAGRCELTVVGHEDILTWVDWIEEHSPILGPARHQTQGRINNGGDMPATGNWLRLRLSLRTQLPVVAPAGTIGNLIKTLDYIPGTYLLQHVTRELQGVNAHAAIARGDLLVTNMTVEVDGAQGRPVPFCLAHPKMSEGLKDGLDVFNLLRDEDGPAAQMKNHREGYVGPTSTLNSLPSFETIDPAVETHNVVADEVQRPTEDIGGVYSYQAIPAGLTLRGDLRLRQSLCDELSQGNANWFSKLQGQIRLGRASKDDYGVVDLEAIGGPEPVNCEPVSGELTVWLLSDLLLRDERLHPTASIESLGQALSDQFKVTLKPQPHLTHARQRRIDSWHVGWGLPRPSLVGLQAGTCAVFTFDEEINPALLAEIAGGGLGERRAEGYGQMCFNDPLVTSELKGTVRNSQKKNGVPEAPVFVSDSVDYARLLEYQAARNEIHRIAPGFAADRENRKQALGIEINGGRSKPRMSQLGALRSVIGHLRSVSDSRRVLDWTERVAKSQNRRTEWPNERPAHVEELMTDTVRVWQMLSVDFKSLVLTEGGEERLKRNLWAEAVRALVNTCVRAHKRDLEGE